MPDSRPLAVLHVVHGMAEHSDRYRRLAETFCGAGVEVWAADMRGHGRTAGAEANDPGKGGLLGHCHDADAFDAVTRDLMEINAQIRASRAGVPLFVMGHSWGSFVVQNLMGLGAEGKPADGWILSGTRGPGGFRERAAIPVMAALCALKGKRRGSRLARALADGPYARAFLPSRTPFDWLSRDDAEVDLYVADPLCGMLCSSGFYRDLARGLFRIHRAETMKRIPVDLPVYVFCGSCDPVGEMGASPAALVNAYRSLGISDMEFVLYPGARHEPLNETNRDEATANLLSWILRKAGERGPGAMEG